MRLIALLKIENGKIAKAAQRPAGKPAAERIIRPVNQTQAVIPAVPLERNHIRAQAEQVWHEERPAPGCPDPIDQFGRHAKRGRIDIAVAVRCPGGLDAMDEARAAIPWQDHFGLRPELGFQDRHHGPRIAHQRGERDAIRQPQPGRQALDEIGRDRAGERRPHGGQKLSKSESRGGGGKQTHDVAGE